MAKLTVKILTPEKISYEGIVNSVIAPGDEGLFGVLPNHAPMIASLVTGKLQIEGEKGVDYIEIMNGFLEVKDNTVTVLSG